MNCFQLHWLVLVSCCVPGSSRLTPSGQKMATCERCRGSLYDAICHNTPTQHRIYDHNLLWRDATTLTTLTCKQLTAVYHILSSYSVHQISSAEEVWGSMVTSRVLGCLFSERKSAKQNITERRRWIRPLIQEKFVGNYAWIAARWWNGALRVTLTCIHRMCRHSCPATPRLGEGLLFLLLLTK